MLPHITFEMNTHLENPVSTKIIERKRHTAAIQAISKPLMSQRDTMKRRQWCGDLQNWTQQLLEQEIWSNESLFTLFQIIERVIVC